MMTREEAAKELEEEFEVFRTYVDQTDWENPNEELRKVIEANTMAIKVLREPPNEDWEKYSEELYYKAYNRGRLDGLKCATEIIEELLGTEV